MPFTYEHSWTLGAPRDRVMAALTEPAQLMRWFAEHVDVELRAGGRYRFWGRHTLGTPAAGDARQQLTRYEAGRHLAFTWSLHDVGTEVAIDVAVDGEQSRLTLQHAVSGELPVPRARELIDDHWRLSMGNLSEHLAGTASILLPDYADPMPEVRMVVQIKAPVAVVWRALTEPALVNRWFGSTSAIVEPRTGGRYELGWTYTVDGREVDAGPTEIIAIVPNAKLVLAWPDWRGDASVTGQTITFLLEPTATGTTLTFVHAGFGRTSDMGDYGFGWKSLVGTLVTLIESPEDLPRTNA